MTNQQAVQTPKSGNFEATPFTCKCCGETAYSGMKPSSDKCGKRPDGRHMWVRLVVPAGLVPASGEVP